MFVSNVDVCGQRFSYAQIIDAPHTVPIAGSLFGHAAESADASVDTSTAPESNGIGGLHEEPPDRTCHSPSTLTRRPG